MIIRLRSSISSRVLRGSSSAGFTLIEMLVAMAIFSILMVIALASVVQISRSTITAEERAQSASGALVVFQNLDRQVRYAESINFAGVSGSGMSYIEFRTSAGASPLGYTTCTQWRYDPDKDVIQMRQWKDGVTPGTVWSTKLTNVSGAASSSYPFQLLPATITGASTQRLALSITSGGQQASDQTDIETTYVARNSSIKSISNVDSNPLDGKSDNPVCNPTGTRS